MSNSRGSGAASAGQSATSLDDVSLSILNVLRENGRVSMAALAERVGISRASAYSRVEALVRDGVITGFSATVDPARVGLDISALVFVTIHPQAWPAFRAALLSMPDVEYACVTTGEHDAMMLIRAADVGAVHHFATDVVAAHDAVKSVVSVVVLDEMVRRPYVLPTDIPDRDLGTERLGMTKWTRAADARSSMASR
jgi:Lrp/AsnC family transcriptional regulator, leucine-responsive regulatory protein